jgi:hypothetical protein
MQNLRYAFIILVGLLTASSPAYAAKPVKERLVLMPLRLSDADKSRQAAMETALVQGLQSRYDVLYGEKVARKVKQVFLKESRNISKKYCDEVRCMKDIAFAFQAELVAIANVSRQDDGYFLALSVQNIFDTKVVHSSSIPCKNCDAYQVVEKLKELGAPPEALLPSGTVSEADVALWNEVQKGNTLTAYLGYVNSFPKGNYLAQANIQIKKLRDEIRVPVMVSVPGKDYEIGKFEVTQGEWKAVMGSNPSYFKSCGEQCPVEQVSWDDAKEYIQKLNTLSGKQYRLPTEAEWKYACYGGNKSDYCGGNDINAVAWVKENSDTQIHAVGGKQPNGYGLHDMTGNAWEWVNDCEGGSCVERVMRGGSWYAVTLKSRAETRGRSNATYKFDSVGFRLARTLP